MKILCVIGSKDVHNITSSTMILNMTILDGIRDLGYSVDLLTISEETDNSNKAQNNLKEYFNNIYTISYKEKSKNKKKKKGLLGKLYNFWIYSIKDILIKQYNKKDLANIVNDEYDIVLALCPPTLSPILANDVIKLSNLVKAKYIQYWSDPITGSLFDYKGLLPKKRLLHRYIENYLLRMADEIVYCTPSLYNMQKEIHQNISGKMRWVDVGFTNKKQNKISSNTKKTTYLIGYFGSYPLGVRNITPLLRVMEYVKNSKLIVRGDSDIDKLQYPNVDIKFERIPLELVVSMEDKCDILICLGNSKGVQIPGKTFYYANYNKPIIFIADGYYKQVIKEYLSSFNRYIICDNNQESIKCAVNEAITMSSNFRTKSLERLKPKNVSNAILNSKLNYINMKEYDSK